MSTSYNQDWKSWSFHLGGPKSTSFPDWCHPYGGLFCGFGCICQRCSRPWDRCLPVSSSDDRLTRHVEHSGSSCFDMKLQQNLWQSGTKVCVKNKLPLTIMRLVGCCLKNLPSHEMCYLQTWSNGVLLVSLKMHVPRLMDQSHPVVKVI